MGTTNLDSISLRNALQSKFITVKFKKKDGSTRIMYCTTNLELIPVDQRPKPTPEPTEGEEEFKVNEVVKESNPNLFKVYEADVGWRSFNFEQVIQ